MKAVIVYKGKYGATQQYADWLATELNLPAIPAREINGEELTMYDFLLIGTSVYIGKLQMQNWMKKNLSFIKKKKIFLFQIAGTPAGEREKRQAYNLSGIPKELIHQCEFYFLAGRMIKTKLSWMDRLMLKMGARLAKDPQDRKNMLTDYDDIRKENITELLAAVKKYMQERLAPVAGKSDLLQLQ